MNLDAPKYLLGAAIDVPGLIDTKHRDVYHANYIHLFTLAVNRFKNAKAKRNYFGFVAHKREHFSLLTLSSIVLRYSISKIGSVLFVNYRLWQ